MPLLRAPSGLPLLVIIVIHRCQSWAGLLIASLLWKVAWHLLVPKKLSPQGEGFQISSSSGALGPGSGSKLHDDFSNEDLSSTSEGQPGAIAITVNTCDFTKFLNHITCFIIFHSIMEQN